MIILTGKPVFGGIARGRLIFYQRDEITVSKQKVSDPEAEYGRYLLAKETAVKELEDLFDRATEDIGADNAQIFYIHKMILEDSQYERFVRDYILEKGYAADYAVAKTAKNFSQLLEEIGSGYIKERTADVKDVSDRVLRHIQKRSKYSPELKRTSIILADDLMPSEIMTLDKSKAVAFCTKYGSTSSHTSILAKTMNIPALIGMGETLSEEYNGKYAILDGYKGVLYIQPDAMTIRDVEREEAEEGRKKELLHRLRGRRTITRDGREIALYANIGRLSDTAYALENDAGGIGLFRSEFMYIQRDKCPDEDFLFYNYRRVLEDMKGKRVVIRTLDIGADKNAEYLGFEQEENPALGVRSIRLCLKCTEIFKTQLRAILRASVYGKLAILIPMVIDVEEIRKVKEIITEVKNELVENNIPFSHDVELGVMIETPAAVITSDLLAKEVDFFSIGTNDLEQYTLAIDRRHPHYESIAPQNHLAVLRMIKIVCDNAHSNGIKVTVCGELGADLLLTELFIDMHVDALSVAPPHILPLRKTIRSLNLSDRRQIHENIRNKLKY